jgi:hypothetical protein
MADRGSRGRVLRWVAAIALVLLIAVAALAWRSGIVSAPHETGYFAPLFSPDGRSVFAIAREVRAIVTGFGAEFFTPPATVRIRRDRFRLVRFDVSGATITTVEELPPSPLEGARIEAYHGAIFGVPHAHLRWADAEHLEYEIAVTRHDSPLSRTFVARKVWNPAARAYATPPPWQEGTTQMAAGDEPQRLRGDYEAIAVPGIEMMPCAIALLDRKSAEALTLVETPACRRKYSSGISVAVLEPLSRRAEIERMEKIKSTYADLVARGRQSGLSEGQAMLDAGKAMQRLGLYPKTPTLVAERAGCDATPLFAISDAEFTYGLFPDIEAAIARPGVEVDKSMGAYITHRDYTTSRQINEHLDAGHTTVVIRARGACWRLTVR